MGPSKKYNKGKRWKKGQSCVTNPEQKKHRLAAKNKFASDASGAKGGSNLTASALQQLDASTSRMDDDARSIATTFASVASNFTECTNMTFNKVQRYWPSNNAFHKEVLAILAAVTEVIKSQGGDETETEYFGALMTTVESVESVESTAATIYLINLAIQKVPKSLLQSKFSPISKSLFSVLDKHVDSGNTSLLKSCVSAVVTLLCALDRPCWTQSETTKLFQGLVKYTLHSKPRVRKAAKEGIVMLLKSGSRSNESEAEDGGFQPHPAASLTATFCISQIRHNATRDESTVMQMVGFLKEMIPTLPFDSIKESCNTILSLLPLGNTILKTICFEALNGLVSSKVSTRCLPPKLNGQLITALYEAAPDDNDTQLMPAWLVVMENAHIHFRRIGPALFLSHLPRIVKSAVKCLDATKSEANATAGAITLKGLIEDLKELPEELVTFGSTDSLTKVYSFLDGALTYQYHKSWNYVLQLLASFVEVFGVKIAHLAPKTLSTLGDLHDSFAFSFKPDLIHTLGKFIRHLGPKIVFGVLTLQPTLSEETGITRSWLLPVLRDNVRNTELGYFTSHLLPLAAKLRDKAKECGEQNNKAQERVLEMIISQIWDSLPGFCTNPTDLAQSFKQLGRTLGTVIADRPDLRLTVLSALRKLISTATEDESRTEVAKYGKNFLPILFNTFTAEPDSINASDTRRLASLETIKVYLPILNQELVHTFFDKCMGKIAEEGQSDFLRKALMELAIVMVQYVDSERLKRVFDLVKPSLGHTDHTVQKKAYRFLEEMCSSVTPRVEKFLADRLDELQTLLITSLAKASPSSQAPRLRCLIHIFLQLSEERKTFAEAVIPEAILCTKAVNMKARESAFTLLLSIGQALVKWAPGEDKTQVLEKYVCTVMAGLCESPQMIHATILALARLVIEYRGVLSLGMMQVLVENCCKLLESKSREIAAPAVGFMKILIGSMSAGELSTFLKDVVTSLTSMKEDNRHHLRYKTKSLYERLVRKFGFETIRDMTPASQHKMLANVKKTQERTKRQENSGKPSSTIESDEEEEYFKHHKKLESIDDLLMDSDDSDLEADADLNPGGRGAHKKTGKAAGKKSGTWLLEKEDSVTDLLDSTMAKNVTGSRPIAIAKRGNKSSTKEPFKRAADGRMLITEVEDEDRAAMPPPGGKPKKRKAVQKDDLDNLFDEIENGPSKGKKRSGGGDGASVTWKDSASALTTSTYRTGGRGIHRDNKSKQGKGEGGESGASFKAKKAGGDVKKGKVDPYAYVPLNAQTLNKRKKAKSGGQFKQFIGGKKSKAAGRARVK